MERVKEFCKAHKKEIVVGTVVTVVSVAGCVLLRKKVKTVDIPESIKSIIPRSKDLPLPKYHCGTWHEFWIDGCTKYPTAIISDINVQFMGDLGNEILNHCRDCGLDISFDSPMQMVLEVVTDQ